MKKLIAMYLGIMLVREIAKYYKINSFEDLMKFVMPKVENLLPGHVENSVGVTKSKSRELTHS